MGDAELEGTRHCQSYIIFLLVSVSRCLEIASVSLLGAEAGVLGHFLGVIARNPSILPINHSSWHDMPDANKNQALDQIKDKFSLEVSDNYLKQALGKKWRDHKSTLKKKYFKNDLSFEQKLQNPPHGILRYQWEDACHFWNSAKGQARERIGVASRQQQKFTHTAGSKSFARIANEQEATSGSNVGRIQLFDITHTKKDGSPITPEAAEIMEKLREKRTEYETSASSAGSAVNMADIDNQVIAEVFGPERYGRVRGTGSFVTPTKYFGSSSSQYMPSQGHSVQAQVELQVERVKQQLQEEMDAKIAAVQAEAAAREAALQGKVDDMQSQLANIMQMLNKNPPQDPPY
ncbi:hypothetical protein V6N11_076322 [Hibiscus sabdariffa]|uniref:Transposase n=1 Tax=Hibiscus sabdariffa TaxID=183260 RepID=A0ABR2Q5Y3_9ROSI